MVTILELRAWLDTLRPDAELYVCGQALAVYERDPLSEDDPADYLDIGPWEDRDADERDRETFGPTSPWE